MNNFEEIKKLCEEDINLRPDCNLCAETAYEVGEKTGYGIVVFKSGTSKSDWFATLSPKTGGDPNVDFTIQLMPVFHLTHFSQMGTYPGLAENFGAAFSKICGAMTTILMRDLDLKATTEDRGVAASIATYGKWTTWKEKKEHLHLKIFPFRGNIGQPYTVDSSFGKKEILTDEEGAEFIKMNPVKKVLIKPERLDKLAKDIIALLK